MWFRRRRERKAAWARYSAIADQIGARDGQLVKEIFMGGLVVPDGLGLITIRPGSAAEVAQAQLDAAVAAGYTYTESNRPPCDSTSPCGFISPPSLPMLTIETFPAGTAFRATPITIPAGHTGVVITIG
jgi:hypothetical protein